MKRRTLIFILLFIGLFLTGSFETSAQSKLVISFQDPASLKKFNSIIPSTNQGDSANAIRSLNKMLASFFDDGYLAASIDSITRNKDTITAFVVSGEQYKWRKLKNG